VSEGADLALIRLLEELGGNATRPVSSDTTRVLEGWTLRAAPGAPFRRANSVLPLGSDDTPLEPRVEAVEQFYAELDLPARFQLSPAARPAELDAVLEHRGYRYDAPVGVFVADTGTVVARTDKGATTISSKIDDEWRDEYAAAHGDDEVARRRLTAYGRLLRDIRPSVTAVVARAGEQLVGIGLGVRERGWVGVYAMGTHPEARRRGAARAVLHTLAEWAQAGDAHRMYLQVEESNTPARTLYESAGFTPLYRYWYRVQP
jgi:GNAT superfamily N-acetyltransferase